MTRAFGGRRPLGLALPALALLTLVPGVARACPMCFTGANSNSQAFVWGSLLLMFVPTTAIGTLIYLALRRIKAIDAAYGPRVPPPPSAVPPADLDSGRQSGERPALRTVPPI